MFCKIQKIRFSKFKTNPKEIGFFLIANFLLKFSENNRETKLEKIVSNIITITEHKHNIT